MGEFSILQLDQEVHFWATVCKKKHSTLKAVRGAFRHSKLVKPLDIQEPVRLSITECSDISTTQILTTEDGRQIRVAKGTKAMYIVQVSGHRGSDPIGRQRRVRRRKAQNRR